MKRIHFFASKRDVLRVTDFVEEKQKVKYILTLHHTHQKEEAPIYESARDIDNIGIATASQTARCQNFLVADRAANVLPIRALMGEETSGGAEWHTFYRSGNCAECVEFNAGGFWSDGALINGLVQTWSDDPAAQRLMRQFSTAMKKIFKEKIGIYWVGPEAYDFLKNGGRLTHNVIAGPEFNLKLPE